MIHISNIIKIFKLSFFIETWQYCVASVCLIKKLSNFLVLSERNIERVCADFRSYVALSFEIKLFKQIGHSLMFKKIYRSLLEIGVPYNRVIWNYLRVWIFNYLISKLKIKLGYIILKSKAYMRSIFFFKSIGLIRT